MATSGYRQNRMDRHQGHTLVWTYTELKQIKQIDNRFFIVYLFYLSGGPGDMVSRLPARRLGGGANVAIAAPARQK